MTTDVSSLGDSVGVGGSIPLADDLAKQWLGDLFAAHYERLCALASRLGLPHWADNEDIVQQAFANLIVHHGDLAVARDQVGVLKFLQKTIHGLVTNYRRDSRLDNTHRIRNADQLQDVAGPSVPASPDRAVTSGGFRAHLDAAVARLPERRREIWLLRQSGMSSADVAALLGITPGTVKLQMSHVLATLRRDLAPYLDGATLSDFLIEDRGGLDV